jgi:MYXO-CTERM domain-containing protein
MNKLITIATLSSLAGFAHADLAQYDNRVDFDAATGAQVIEDFESETLGQFAMPTTFASWLGANLYTGAVSSLIEAGDPDGYGLLNTTDGGRKYLRLGQRQPTGAPETGSYGVEFSFAQTVRGFGFDLSGFQPAGGADGFNVSLFRNGQMVEDFFVFSDQPFGVAEFYGFTRTDGFDTARVFIPMLNGASMDADYVAFDGVTWSTVPTPASLALLTLGGLVGSRRRRA